METYTYQEEVGYEYKIFVIYQIDNSEKNREYRCRSYEYQIKHGFMITADNYGTGYSGTATRGMGEEAIRKKMESMQRIIDTDENESFYDKENQAYLWESIIEREDTYRI